MVKRPLQPRRRPPTIRRASLAALAVAYGISNVVGFCLLPNSSIHRRRRRPTRTAAATTDCKSIIPPASSLDGNISATSDPDVYNRELFSFAPLMGHTNKHYHKFFRNLSRHTHLYTEMIPSSQILRAYKRARYIYMDIDPLSKGDIHPEEILEVVGRIKANPGREYQLHGKEREQVLTLHQLVGSAAVDGPVALQLGGRDPSTLGAAAAIGAAFGDYHSVNLNCGCPSNAVGGRSGGCALMNEPDTVARCVEEMNAQTTALSHLTYGNRPSISVKHRLGVRDAVTFDAHGDKKKNDSEAFEECSSFVRAVSLGGSVSKFHVHARLGLLGEFEDEDDATKRQRLWVPSDDTPSQTDTARTKIDHKREQERAKRRARKATIQNRHVPPLRPAVVARLADEFPQLEFVSNGGIQDLSDVERIVESGLMGTMDNRIVGAMVGRAAINHPCSFAAADRLWEKRGESTNDDPSLPVTWRPSRGEVLQDFIQYCDKEEDFFINMGVSTGTLDVLRRRLIAVPFHLFMGEIGNDEFQRRLKKLKSKTDQVKASSILSGAASFIPPQTLEKCVDDFVPWNDIAKYEGGLKRGSAMQRIIY